MYNIAITSTKGNSGLPALTQNSKVTEQNSAELRTKARYWIYLELGM